MLTEIEQKKIWIVGSIERLAFLGYFKQFSLRVEEEFVETYWKIDDNRHEIFNSGEEVVELIIDLYPELSPFDVSEVFDLLAAFKNSRTKVFANGMKKLVLS
jgi:hypothetical protein